MTQPPEVETLHRARRIETRLTQLMIGLGIGTQAQKPVFTTMPGQVAVLEVPSMHSSLKEIIDNIPPDWEEPVEIWIGRTYVASIGVR